MISEAFPTLAILWFFIIPLTGPEMCVFHEKPSGQGQGQAGFCHHLWEMPEMPLSAQIAGGYLWLSQYFPGKAPICTNSVPKPSWRSSPWCANTASPVQVLALCWLPLRASSPKELRWNLAGAVWETEINSRNCRSYYTGFCCSLECYSLAVSQVSVAPHLWHEMGSQWIRLIKVY